MVIKSIKNLIIVLLILLTLLFFIDGSIRKDNKTILYKLNGKNYRFFVAKNEKEWEKGLMYYRTLNKADGMIFIFPDKEYRSFWNKNTYLSLDIFWLNDNNVVGKDYLPSIEESKKIMIINSPKPVDKVIELVKH